MLLRRAVESCKVENTSQLINDVRGIGKRLVDARPNELAIGNIVRRILGLIRVELEENRDTNNAPVDAGFDTPSALTSASTSAGSQSSVKGGRNVSKTSPRNGPIAPSNVHASATPRSMFDLLSQPADSDSHNSDLESAEPHIAPEQASIAPKISSHPDPGNDLRAEVVEGIMEIIEEVKQADEQIAGFALEHIHPNEIILTHSASETVRRFLIKAASKRKFTVFWAEGSRNDVHATHPMLISEKGKTSESNSDRHKNLKNAGITVILIPDSAVFAVMSRVNKVILDAHAVTGDGGLIASSGSSNIARAAKFHRVPVMVLSGVYKLSPVYPFDVSAYLEEADLEKIVPFEDRKSVGSIEIVNPRFDYVSPEFIDIYITNL